MIQCLFCYNKHSVLLFIGAFLNNIATKFHKVLSQHQWFCLFEQEIIDNIATHNQNSHSLSLYNFTKYHPCKKHALYTLILAPWNMPFSHMGTTFQ